MSVQAPFEIIWMEPPARTRHVGGKYEELGDALRAHPGQWAKFPAEFTKAGNAAGVADGIRKGRYTGLTNCEAVSRRISEDAFAVFLRYVEE